MTRRTHTPVSQRPSHLAKIATIVAAIAVTVAPPLATRRSRAAAEAVRLSHAPIAISIDDTLMPLSGVVDNGGLAMRLIADSGTGRLRTVVVPTRCGTAVLFMRVAGRRRGGVGEALADDTIPIVVTGCRAKPP